MSRLTMIPHNELTPAQAEACAEAMQGPRGKVPAPMVAWLRNPELARRTQKVGEVLRFGASLDPCLRELAILICARHWTSHHEWTAHKRIALAEGLALTVIDALAEDAMPPFENAAQELVYRLSRAILQDGRLSDPLYGEGLNRMGETALVELVATLGYYCLVGLTLNVFELGLPESHAPELERGGVFPAPVVRP